MAAVRYESETLIDNAKPALATNSVTELAKLFHQLERSYRHLRQHIAKELGFSQVELTALLAVGNEDAASPGALTEELGFTSGAVTAVLDRLSRAGYLRREKHPVDRRGVVILLTARGEEVLEIIWDRHHRVLRQVISETPCLTDVERIFCLKKVPGIIRSAANAQRVN